MIISKNKEGERLAFDEDERCNGFVVRSKKQKNMHLPGIEPGSPAWKASIMPLDHKCFFLLNEESLFEYSY